MRFTMLKTCGKHKRSPLTLDMQVSENTNMSVDLISESTEVWRTLSCEMMWICETRFPQRLQIFVINDV